MEKKAKKEDVVLIKKSKAKRVVKKKETMKGLKDSVDGIIMDDDPVAYPVTGDTFEDLAQIKKDISSEDTLEVHPPKVTSTNVNPTSRGEIVGGEITKKHRLDAGLDIKASDDFQIPGKGFIGVPAGIRISVPEGYVGLIKPRSGIGFGSGIDTGAGVVDAGYRGEVKVLLFNHSNKRYIGKKGERIAQLLTIPVNLENYVVVEELSEAERGDKGFGSSGN